MKAGLERLECIIKPNHLDASMISMPNHLDAMEAKFYQRKKNKETGQKRKKYIYLMNVHLKFFILIKRI
jgi:hypothetical protein